MSANKKIRLGPGWTDIELPDGVTVEVLVEDTVTQLFINVEGQNAVACKLTNLGHSAQQVCAQAKVRPPAPQRLQLPASGFEGAG